LSRRKQRWWRISRRPPRAQARQAGRRHLRPSVALRHHDARRRETPPTSPALTFTMKALIAGLLLGALALAVARDSALRRRRPPRQSRRRCRHRSPRPDLHPPGGEAGPRRLPGARREVGAAIFSNIAQSEQQHMDVMLTMLSRYRLPIRWRTRPGVFVDPFLQDSTADSSRAAREPRRGAQGGRRHRDLDIVDIRTRLGSSPPRDVTNAYQNLMKARATT